MKTLRCICLGLLLILGLAYGQTNSFVKTYAAERGIHIGSCLVTEDHGFIVTGDLWNIDNPNRERYDGFAIRADSLGNVLWSRAFNSVADTQYNDVSEVFADMAAAPANGWLLAGYASTDSVTAGSTIPYFVRLGLAGDTLWTRRLLCPNAFCYDHAYAVNATADSGFVAFGGTYVPGLYGMAPTVIEIGPNGDSLRALRYDISDTITQPNDFLHLPDGSHLCVMQGFQRMTLLRLDASYQPIWCKTYRMLGGNVLFPQEAMALPDGSVVIGGYKFSNPSTDAMLLKVDPTGDIVWAHSYHDGNLPDQGYSIAQAPDGGWFIGGGSTDSYQGILIKTDSLGNFDWARRYGNRFLNQVINKVNNLPGGGLLLAGRDGYNTQTVYMVRTDAAYQVPCYDTTQTLQANAETFSISNLSVQAVPYPGRWASAPTVQRQFGNLETDCGIVGVVPAAASAHKLYPNPMAQAGTLELPATLHLDGAELQLVDALGQVAWRQSGIVTHRVPVQVGGLAPGIYAYRLVQGTEVLVTGRLVVAR